MTKPPRPLKLAGESIRLSGDSTLRGRAAELAAATLPHNTERAYRGHIERFDRFCTDNGFDAWDPSIVADYLAACYEARKYGAVALNQCATALRTAYRVTGREHRHTSWADVIDGAKRELTAKPNGRGGEAEALRMEDLHAAVRALYRQATEQAAERDRNLRDRAMLLIGFYAGLRRSEIIALDVADLEEKTEGLIVRIRGSKTARTTTMYALLPRGRDPAACPVTAWRDWRDRVPTSLGLEGDPAWLATGRTGRLGTRRLPDGHTIERIIQRALVAADFHQSGLFTAHSLRAGLATELAERGVPIPSIANAGRWKRLDTVLRYARRARRWKDSPLHILAY